MLNRRWSGLFAAVACLAALVAADTPPKTLRVACIGDSITFSAFEGERSESAYPAQLQRMLGDGYEVRNFGVSGATMLKKSELPYWGLPAFKAAQEFAPDIVVIKLGTNDSKPQHWDREAYDRDYRAMLDLLQALPSNPKIVLCRPVPAFEEKFGIRNSVIVGEIIPIVDKLSNEKGLPVVDAYNALLDDGATFPDGIHPNAAGCRVLAQAVADTVRLVSGTGK